MITSLTLTLVGVILPTLLLGFVHPCCPPYLSPPSLSWGLFLLCPSNPLSCAPILSLHFPHLSFRILGHFLPLLSPISPNPLPPLCYTPISGSPPLPCLFLGLLLSFPSPPSDVALRRLCLHFFLPRYFPNLPGC